jgi:hypothetical protein
MRGDPRGDQLSAHLTVNRTRFLGHSVGLRGHGHGRKLVLAASCVWAEVAVFLDSTSREGARNDTLKMVLLERIELGWLQTSAGLFNGLR